MAHCIAVFCGQLLKLLLPSHGRHRAAALPPQAAKHRSVPLRPRAPLTPLLCGEDSALVRPYVLSLAERHNLTQRRHLRALRPAVHGLEIGPRWIHGTGVAS
ncbi:hypothetical protein [Streptomyces sp. NPDC058595]|uniref:hypothetical protein n=1 Tax=Streptomyces sp. NPDC058595 TaxID=3346550 RepID=UPI00365A2582